MTPGGDDQSQIPIEHLAQQLLQRMREDSVLGQRAPANDDDMNSRLAMVPAMRPAAPLRLPTFPARDPASLEAMEELIAVALTSAHEAEDLSREAQDATRRARRGMLVAITLGFAGIAVAVGGTAYEHFFGADNRMTAIAAQIQALDGLQHQISDQLSQLQSQTAAQEASAMPPPASVAAPTTAPAMLPSTVADPSATAALPPLTTVPISVLPAHAAVPIQRPESASAVSTSASPADYVTGTVPSPMLHPPMLPRPRPVYYRRRPVYYSSHRQMAFVMPWPAVYFIQNLQSRVGALFR